MDRRCTVLSLVLLGMPRHADAQPSAAGPAPLTANRVSEGSITVDANPSEPEWNEAQRRGGFEAREPHEGKPSDPTFVSLLYDDHALYVLVELVDHLPEQIEARLTRRDEASTSDWVSVYLCTQKNQRFAYRFSVNAAGVKQDARVLDGVNEDLAYDALWDAAVRRHARGWTVEFRIPFHQLNYGGRPDFRAQVLRYQTRTGEQSALFHFPKSATDIVRYLGPIEGIERLPNTIHAEIAPYLSLTWNDQPWSLQPQVHIGGDFKLTLSPEVVLNATINPDFGQVEADPSELNLSVFETFFPERRPFFLEGLEILDFGLRNGITSDRLFYTRRIGQPPRVDPSVDSDNVIDYPRQTRILAATKLSARTSQGYNIGMLHALTDETYATVRDVDTNRRVRVAPLTQYVIARGVRDFSHGRTLVGAMLTTVSREVGSDLSPSLAKTATTAGVDVEHRSGDIKLAAKAFASHIQGSAEAIASLQKDSVHYYQRPDQHHARFDPMRTVLDGWGLTVVGSKYSGAPLRAAWGGSIVSPGFEPNDVGFLQRADDINAYVYLQYIETKPTRYYRSYYFDVNMWTNFTFGGESTSRCVLASANWTLPDTSSARLSIERDAERLDPRVLRGGPALRVPARNLLSLLASTNDRHPISLDAMGWSGVHEDVGSYWVGGLLQLRIRPSSSIQLTTATSYQHSLDGWAYVDQPVNANAIVARMPRDTLSLTLRASFALSPNLTLQLYTMPYLSAASRYSFAEVVNAQAASTAERFRPIEYTGDRAIWFAQTRTNAVLRWEYSPGSTAYLVWSREQYEERKDRNHVELDRDLPRLLSAEAVDTIMLKWSPRISY